MSSSRIRNILRKNPQNRSIRIAAGDLNNLPQDDVNARELLRIAQDLATVIEAFEDSPVMPRFFRDEMIRNLLSTKKQELRYMTQSCQAGPNLSRYRKLACPFRMAERGWQVNKEMAFYENWYSSNRPCARHSC